MSEMKKTILLAIIASFLIIPQIFISLLPFVEATETIPLEYSNEIDLNKVYVYNVTDFVGPSEWYNFSTSEGFWETGEGGQIKINFTGFYDRPSEDLWGDDFPDTNMPYMDIFIYEPGGNLNFTQINCSNSEASSAMILGYWPFNSGFLIPKNISFVQEILKNTSLDYIIEESYNFLYMNIEDKSELIYDKFSGLLIYANTFTGNYGIEISLTNYSLNLNRLYQYNISEFGDSPAWWYVFSDKGYFETNEGGLININFTGYYDRPSEDLWGDAFPDSHMAYMDLEIYNKSVSGLSLNFTQVNISNKEAAVALILGFNNFQSGFLQPSIDNLTHFKKLALEEATGFSTGKVELEETDLTVKIEFDEEGDGLNIKLLYEKNTGLLLWAASKGSNYNLELTIDGYEPWSSNPPNRPSGEYNLAEYIPYIVIALISLISISGLLITSNYKTNFKKYNKFAIIGIIIAASFGSLIYFGVSYSPPTVNQKLEKVQDLTLVIDYGNGTISNYTNFELTNYETTAFDALNKSVSVQYTDYGAQGYFIESINGAVGNWLYYINDNYVSVAANNYFLESGDIILFELQ
ncbi:MAG: DUF4430 domain-containing protein [Promethearchaeota archaeon]|nr:MAG: DUF4430 domain-containing protein [Candidatus Lokiarchaeota archaeon]